MKILMGMLMMLLVVPFFSLLERKFLSLLQNRVGPEKIFFSGLLQPVSDFLKLSKKSFFFYNKTKNILFFVSPCVLIVASYLFYYSVPNFFYWKVGVSLLFVVSVLCLGVYSPVGAGAATYCKYSLLGATRAMAQSISYEISLVFIIFCMFFLKHSTSGEEMQEFFVFSGEIMLLIIWFISMLAELGRSPFDFIEGESEIVSGFSTEYSGGGFLLFFLGEYLMMLMFSQITVLFFFSKSVSMEGIVEFFVLSGFIYLRGILPRMRYDLLMYLCWKTLLPCVILYFFFIFSKKEFVF